MSQNRSTAVMQRRIESLDSLDDFPTPPWATRALCEWLRAGTDGFDLSEMSAREPAANRGYMARPLAEYFGSVEAFDVHDYGSGFPKRDYLSADPLTPVSWTITNPPFRLAEQFIDRALDTSSEGVAVLVRSAFLEGVGRHERLFRRTPPSYVLQFTERVPMVKGRFDPRASPATAYVWMVWRKDSPEGAGTRLHWIPPCRKSLQLAEEGGL